MGEDLTIYTAGLRVDGEYSEFVQSNDESRVDEYIDIMKDTKFEESEIVKHIKTYRCISTVPTIIK